MEESAQQKPNNFLVLLASFNIVLAIFCSLLLGNPQKNNSLNKIAQIPLSDEEKILGESQRNYSAPRIVVSGGDGYASGGVIPIASTDEPAVYVTSYQYSGEVDISLYRSDKNSLLDYLTYDKDNKQIKKKPDTNSLQLVTNIKQNVTSGYNSETKVVLPLEETGIWLMVLNRGSVQNYAYIIRSSFGVLAKTGNNQLIFWAQDFNSKRSINSGNIQTYNLLNKPTVLQESSFDTKGIATTKIGSDIDVAIAQSNGVLALIPVNMSYLGSNYKSFNAKGISTRYYLFTDRPVYQPGDTVYYKAILRDDDDARYSIPTGSASVKVYKGWDEKENVVYDKNSIISSEGSVYGEFKLPADAGVGDYQLKVSTGKKTSTGDWYDWDNNYVNFQVQYYRKPEYFIDIITTQKEVIPPNKLSFTITGSYFSGQPLSGATVKYSVYTTDAYNYGYYSDYSYLNSGDDYYWYNNGQNKIQENTVILNKDGKAEIDIATKDTGGNGKNRIFVISAEYDNGSGNPSYERKNVLVYAGGFNIYRQDYGYGSQVGKELTIPLILKPVGSGNIANIPLKIKVKKEYWVPYLVENQKYPDYKKMTEEFPEINLTTGSLGQATIKYTPQSEGSYTFTVTAVDSDKNIISNDFYTWVTSKDYSFNYDQYQNQLSVKASKTKYLPGEKASIVIYSQIPNRDVFLSFERSRMDNYQVVSLNGNSAIVETTITDSYIPNIFAHVSSFSDFMLDDMSSNIEVSAESKKILVNITADKESYSPRDTVTLNISTTDVSGNPVSAETAVWGVDKALFELVDEKPAKIFETFWKTRYDNTPQANSLQGIVVPTSEMGGGGGGPARSVFEDTVYWNPAVKTDNNGRAKVSFRVSDNLTTWLFFGIAANNKTQVGQNTTEIIVSKEVIVRPILPNILRVGDEIELSAIVQNFTNTDREFIVGMEFDSGTVEEPKQGSLTIKSNDYQKISWKVTPQKENPNSKLTFFSQTKDKPQYQDEVIMEVPVLEFGFFEQSSQSGDGDKTYPVILSPLSDKQKSLITLSLAPSLYGSLLPSMQYLIHYPYGCVEQITSTFVPAIIAKQNPDMYGEYLKDEDLDTDIKAGVLKLSDMQKPDGGWSWWRQLNDNSFITAYVVEYLSNVRDLGFDVKDALGNARGYLKYLPQNSSQEEIINRAYGLSFYPDENKISVGFDNVTPDILALAIMTNIKAGNKDPQTNGLSKLISLAKNQGEDVYWTAGSQADFGSINASTALAVRAMIAGGADRDLIANAVRFLLRSRTNVYWSNSFATSQTVAAITGFAKTGNENNPNYILDVSLNAESIKSEKVKNIQQKIKDVNILATKIKDGGSNLTVRKSGEGQIYSTLVINEWTADMNTQPKENGISIKREYLDKDGNVYKKIGVGDEITVRFTVPGLETSYNYGILSDELPSGLVPVNESFKNEQYDDNQQSNNWQNASVDIIRSGANFYLYQINPGENVFTYRARAVNAGEFLVPPAKVSLMYSPEVWGRTGAQKITVSDTKEVILTPLPKNIKIIGKKTNNTAKIIAIVTVALGFLIIILKAVKRIKRKHVKDNLPPIPPPATPAV